MRSPEAPRTDLSSQAEIDALQRENAVLRAEVTQLRSSLRMRAATIFAEAASSPRALISAPGRLWSLGREILNARAWRRVILGLECGLPDDALRHTAPGPGSASTIKKLGRHILSGTDLPRPALHVTDPALIEAVSRIDELTRLVRDGPDWPPPAAQAAGPVSSRRVLMALHTGQPDQTNGYARRSHEILTALSALGWEAQGALRSPANDTGIPEALANLYHRIGPVIPETNGLDAYIAAYADRLFEDIQRTRPALVHAASNHVTGRAAALAARRAGLPFIYEVRGLWEVTRQSVEPLYAGALGYRAQRRMEIETAKAADRLFVNGEAIADLFRDAGIPSERIVQVPNGVAPDQAPDPAAASALKARWGLDDRPVIGFAGSITSYEGLADLFAACASLKHVPFQLLIIGDGPDMPALQNEAKRLGLDGQICWTGRVTPEDARTAYAFIDIAPLVRKDSPVTRLVPPLKPLDVMAGKAALIVSDLPPLTEFAADGRGVIVPPGSPTALAAALQSLLQDEASRTAMTQAAFAWIHKARTWPEIASRIAGVYSDLLSRLPPA